MRSILRRVITRAPFVGWVVVIALMALPSHAATRHALLVGVSDYPSLAEEGLQLKGPKHDVEMVRATLPRWGFEKEHIEVLANGGVEDGNAPTRHAILEAMKRLGTKAEAGDFIYLHFSGHGSQQPARDKLAESDGYDEIFLPEDIGQWDYGKKAVENAIVDHAGTVTRALPVKGIRERRVPPSVLGVPPEAIETAVAKATPTRGRMPAPQGALETEGDGKGLQGGWVALLRRPIGPNHAGAAITRRCSGSPNPWPVHFYTIRSPGPTARTVLPASGTAHSNPV